MLDKAAIRSMFAKGKEREVLLFAYLYAHAFDGWSISAVEIQSRFGIPKTSLNRIMSQKWNGSGTEVEWKWNKSALIFSKLEGKSGTEVERKWNGNGIESAEKLKPKTRKSNPSERDTEVEKTITDVIAHLNQATGKRFTTKNTQTRKVIRQRLTENFTFNDFCQVIDLKSSEWVDTEYDKYLRPITLFGNKFESYLNSKNVQKKQETINFHAKISRNEKYQVAAERAGKIDYGTFTDIRESDNGKDEGKEDKGF